MKHLSLLVQSFVFIAWGSLAAGCRPVQKAASSSTTQEPNRPQEAAASAQAAFIQAAKSALKCPTSIPFQIVGGQTAKASDLVTKSTLKLWIRGQKFCTATLIGPQHLVTAAHCIFDVKDPKELRLGHGVQGQPQERLRVKSFQIHPEFEGIPMDTKGYKEVNLYDVAILVLEAPILDLELVPVALASPEALYPGMPVLMAGYGAYQSEDKERRPLTQVEQELHVINPSLRELQLKAGRSQGACFGDSGGPTFIVGPEKRCLLLIASTTGPSRNSDYRCESGGGTLMDLTRYQGWMRCAFQRMGSPLAELVEDASSKDCQDD